MFHNKPIPYMILPVDETHGFEQKLIEIDKAFLISNYTHKDYTLDDVFVSETLHTQGSVHGFEEGN